MSVCDPKPRASGVDAVNRALSLLTCFNEGETSVSLTRLSELTGLYKSTVLRLAASLEQAGYLVRQSDKTYGLGAELMRLGSLYARSFRLEGHVRPVLKTLLRQTGESSSFFAKAGHQRVCLFREDSLHGIRDHIHEGDLLSLQKGAAGHVLQRFEQILGDPGGLRMALSALPERSFGERDAETAAMAVPVFAAGPRLAGALSLSGPITRFGEDNSTKMAAPLLQAARALSDRLGGGMIWADAA
ncbi:IclR family transcriptional regulator [Acidisphaera sp. L21]|uniref:IclR family transcriptional regulator n=1 Tax=Acidisphaera sp. L21 TaxID=1641851 RepID=UPI00131C04BF|nr:IclR family transcriptional regulator [Acidisphaera sp. L21]